MTLLAIIIAGVLGTGCEKQSVSGSAFYAVDSVLQRQVIALTRNGSRLEKIVSLNSKIDTVTYVPDSTGWVKELEFMAQLDAINKPVNRELYHVSNDQDSRSNLTLLNIKTTEELPVRSLTLFYLRNPSDLRRIQGVTKESNAMFEGTRELRFDFENVQGEAVLKGYTINGGQKMFLGDSVTYTITATISGKHGQAK